MSDQVGLDAGERSDNLTGALAVPFGGARLLTAGPVVLVDDLMTTGASLAEAARAVRAANGLVSGGAVIAAAVRSPGVGGNGESDPARPRRCRVTVE